MKTIYTGHKRNLPCYCGSGKKYKVCCYAKDCDQNEKIKDERREILKGLKEGII